MGNLLVVYHILFRQYCHEEDIDVPVKLSVLVITLTAARCSESGSHIFLQSKVNEIFCSGSFELNMSGLALALQLFAIYITQQVYHAAGSTVNRKFLHSATSAVACADVYIVPMFNINYGFIMVDRKTKKAALIDPGDPLPVIQAAIDLKVDVKLALVTHRHGDHSGGNKVVKEKLPDINIIGTGYEKVNHITHRVIDGDSIFLGSLKIDVIHTPCHTKGHVVYLVSSNDPNADTKTSAPILFSGDTLFVGGCGHFFEGTASEMLTNMDRLGDLPAETQVYCGHEFTMENLQFLSTIDTDSKSTSQMLEEVMKKRIDGVPTVPTTIGRELEYNLFMKCREKRTLTLTKRDTPIETMARLRELNNQFRSVA